MSNRDKHRSEFLTILNAQDCGAKLARFEDWAACHDPKDVRDAIKTDDRPALIMPLRIPSAPDKKIESPGVACAKEKGGRRAFV
jgi:hypothetical protein